MRRITQRCEEMEKVNRKIMAETQSYGMKMIKKVIAIEEHATPVHFPEKQAKELYEATKAFLQKWKFT